MCDKVIFKEPFILKYCHDRHKTQEMCDKAVDIFYQHYNLFLTTLLQIKCFKKLDNDVFSNNIVFLYADSDFVTYFSDDRDLNTINFDNITIDNDNFDEDDPETIINVKLMA